MIRSELRLKRKQLGLTQLQVAKLSDISRPFYANIESGRKDPSINVCLKIAKSVNMRVEDIFFDHHVHKGNIA